MMADLFGQSGVLGAIVPVSGSEHLKFMVPVENEDSLPLILEKLRRLSGASLDRLAHS